MSQLSKAMIGCEPIFGRGSKIFAENKGIYSLPPKAIFGRAFRFVLCDSSSAAMLLVFGHTTAWFLLERMAFFLFFYESKIGTDFARGVNSVLEAWESIHGNARCVIQLRSYCPERGYLSDLTVYVCFSNYVPHEYSDWEMCRDVLDFIMRYEVLMAHVCHSRLQSFTNIFNYRTLSHD